MARTLALMGALLVGMGCAAEDAGGPASPADPLETDGTAGFDALPAADAADSVAQPETDTGECAPACAGRECGPDGCGGSCGSCGAGLDCDASGQCGPACKPDCSGIACGPDPACGADCGACGDGYGCVDGACVEAKPGLPPGQVSANAVARRSKKPVAVDGVLAFDEWAGSKPLLVTTEAAKSIGGKSWQVGGEDDIEVTVALLYDDANLYVAAQVHDDVHDIGDVVAGQWWWDDSLSLFFDLDAGAKGDAWKDGDNAFSFLFTDAGGPEAVWWRQGHDGGAEEKSAAAVVESAVSITGDGYELEAAIPLAALSENIWYRFGASVGFSILLADPDGDCAESPCQLMWVGAGDDQSTWGALAFEDFEDADGDGWGSWIDCEDAAPDAHPGGTEVPGNGLDDDCNGQVDSAPACPAGEKGCGSGCCPAGSGCAGGQCCNKSCDGKECGPDGCAGSCGTCGPSETCTSGGACASGMDLWPKVPAGGPVGAAWPALDDTGSTGTSPPPPSGPRTIFQTNSHYKPELAVRADQVLVHRHSHDAADIQKALASWAGHGYALGRMFFVGSDANLEYCGSLDHPDVERDDKGKPITVGGRPYMVPSPAWTKWCKELSQHGMSGGAETIYPEEPLLHQSGGWSQRFQDAWQDFYGAPWQAPTSSTTAFWKASKLKAELYYDLVAELADQVKGAGKELVVPVHSLLSFASGKMIFPHGRTFAHPAVLGMIAQVWTWPVKSLLDDQHTKCSTDDAKHKDCDFFEGAFLLYSYFANLARGSDKRMYFLADPADDDPSKTWAEYEEWYKETVAAALSFPWISQFELLPWPDRIFLPSELGGDGPTPEAYRVQLQAIFNVQREVGSHPDWEAAASPHGVGIVVGDSFLWQRKNVFAAEGVTGFGLPLVRAGIPVDVVPIERFEQPGFLARYRTLVVGFDGWKPLQKVRLQLLAQWVEDGGVLLLVGSGDSYDGVPEWWVNDGLDTPADAVLAMLGAKVVPGSRAVVEPELLAPVQLTPVAETPLTGELGALAAPRPPIAEFDAFAAGGRVAGYDLSGARSVYEAGGKSVVFDQNVGKGALVFAGISPTDLAWDEAGAKVALALTRYAGEAWGGLPVRKRPHFHLRRGPYHVVSGHQGAPTLTGHYVNVFHPDLPIEKDPKVPKGRARILVDVGGVMTGSAPRVLWSNQELAGLSESAGETSFVARGLSGTPARVRIWAAAKSVAGASSGVQSVPDAASKSVLLVFDATPDGKTVTVSWK